MKWRMTPTSKQESAITSYSDPIYCLTRKFGMVKSRSEDSSVLVESIEDEEQEFASSLNAAQTSEEPAHSSVLLRMREVCAESAQAEMENSIGIPWETRKKKNTSPAPRESQEAEFVSYSLHDKEVILSDGYIFSPLHKELHRQGISFGPFYTDCLINEKVALYTVYPGRLSPSDGRLLFFVTMSGLVVKDIERYSEDPHLVGASTDEEEVAFLAGKIEALHQAMAGMHRYMVYLGVEIQPLTFLRAFNYLFRHFQLVEARLKEVARRQKAYPANAALQGIAIAGIKAQVDEAAIAHEDRRNPSRCSSDFMLYGQTMQRSSFVDKTICADSGGDKVPAYIQACLFSMAWDSEKFFSSTLQKIHRVRDLDNFYLPLTISLVLLTHFFFSALGCFSNSSSRVRMDAFEYYMHMLFNITVGSMILGKSAKQLSDARTHKRENACLYNLMKNSMNRNRYILQSALLVGMAALAVLGGASVMALETFALVPSSESLMKARHYAKMEGSLNALFLLAFRGFSSSVHIAVLFFLFMSMFNRSFVKEAVKYRYAKAAALLLTAYILVVCTGALLYTPMKDAEFFGVIYRYHIGSILYAGGLLCALVYHSCISLDKTRKAVHLVQDQALSKFAWRYAVGLALVLAVSGLLYALYMHFYVSQAYLSIFHASKNKLYRIGLSLPVHGNYLLKDTMK
ncbi:uncharacterized protein NEMAJ01_1728 [Nematocida major]|uniref:uncharacterized protein n=1 Tax=Nematocida major TaxID=1912982 RepID=UPI002008265F|nr:uncharacterized protein NEMAJ01_1728 [Nematocida major]KAH9386832.1 hypothetical protein NEMAJ01_1728 [Nematocida major]